MRTPVTLRSRLMPRRAFLGATLLALALPGCGGSGPTDVPESFANYAGIRMVVYLPSGAEATYDITPGGVTPGPVTLQRGASGLAFQGLVGGRTVDIANELVVRFVGTPSGGAMPAGLAYLRNSEASGQFTLDRSTLSGTVYLQVLRGTATVFEAAVPVRAGAAQ